MMTSGTRQRDRATRKTPQPEPARHGDDKIHDQRPSQPATDDPALTREEATPGSGMFHDDGDNTAPSG
ncbi:hypothetical protein JQ557_13015 [Bradyrhizobium sp. U87765 SZCCT0131]|uniref:hypothetical protein n=1 Tax=unclassified Bradyrhizobium TaxID=2631580 RepID=UPI001BAA3553|nr:MULTISPECIES: hypothetical protein [unclassified Bradyrhizobium]MBR1218917.1 hypothetical protein [Bradyrhizobium sp. U87765 SZCCT0131]MBR1261568.1 hypothetical protein [Bradyrhizobium sp. U87765 SZCCT0134]MBR1306579.1 hypothetical protein [Bradyrhizobium sp. U87765 SZCCT0110]MBR1317350.1 hypothetical protein [Bradyrhizobium sp. U87765 SZCCT0109]MBR1351052.1 hypothetical protein [Bradyrhizobium sp. U87765 SZCCT0048]